MHSFEAQGKQGGIEFNATSSAFLSSRRKLIIEKRTRFCLSPVPSHEDFINATYGVCWETMIHLFGPALRARKLLCGCLSPLDGRCHHRQQGARANLPCRTGMRLIYLCGHPAFHARTRRAGRGIRVAIVTCVARTPYLISRLGI